MGIAAAVLVLLCGAVVGCGVAFFDLRVFPGCDLDRKRWDDARQLVREGEPQAAFERAEPEVEDIVKCDDLVLGKTRADVIELLGRPSSVAKGRGYSFYAIGRPEDLSDYPPLEIRFDGDGIAIDAAVGGYIER